MKIVGRAEPDQTPLRVEKLVIDVHEEHVLAIMQAGNDLVGLFDLQPIGIGRAVSARVSIERHPLRQTIGDSKHPLR